MRPYRIDTMCGLVYIYDISYMNIHAIWARQCAKALAIGAGMLVCAAPLYAQREGEAAERVELGDGQFGGLAGASYDKGKGEVDWHDLYYDLSIFFDYEDDFFFFAGSFGLTSQGKYTGPEFRSDTWLELHEGVMGVNINEFYIAGGYQAALDVVDTPYSLFASSQNIPAPYFEFSYEGDLLFASTRWVGLNELSALDFQDRGMNYRTFGIHFADYFTIGYQEAIIYLAQPFNPLYFFVPVPYQVTQLIYSTAGSPAQTAPGPNTLLGLYASYEDEIHYGFLQLLIDDTSPLDLFEGYSHKIAWSVGYRFTSDIGSFGLYHGGATKYTFQNTHVADLYPYIYYPTTQYETRDGTKTLWYFDNYIGYKYGENNLAIRLEYDNEFFDIWGIQAGLEYVVSGSKAPTDPWHELDAHPRQTFLLDEDILEHTITLDIGSSVTLFNGIADILVDLTVGYVINELELIANTNEPAMGMSIFAPSATDRLLFQAFVGVQIFYNRFTPRWRSEHGIAQNRR